MKQAASRRKWGMKSELMKKNPGMAGKNAPQRSIFLGWLK